MAKIEYENDFSVKRSSKGKIPWMQYEGEAVADSQFCVEYLNRKLNIDLNSHLTEEQRAVAHAFRKMAEENLFWCMGLSRAENLDYVKKHIKLNKLVIWIGTRIYLSNTIAHGIGRHTHEEVLHIMEEDLRSLSVYLGTKKFYFGDQPCETDAALFGLLCQFCWQCPGSKGEQLVNDKFTNLVEYCERMKATFWPDWEDCITADGTKTATKQHENLINGTQRHSKNIYIRRQITCRTMIILLHLHNKYRSQTTNLTQGNQ
ncbi:failed axon connections homolog isoform X4 [Haliotis rubra]|nr:failed axon connections homolog isoform X4 [Haliotis rubra]